MQPEDCHCTKPRNPELGEPRWWPLRRIADPELEEALKEWFPAFRKPILVTDWEKLLSQAATFAVAATETHKQAVATQMPLWFRQKTARARYRRMRRYARLRRRVQAEKVEAAEKLLHALGIA